MKHFFRGGIGLSKKWGHESFIYQSERKLNVFRFLHYGSRYKIGTQRNDVKEGRCSEDRRSLRTTFGLASPLLRPYNTHLPRIHHRFTTFASEILDENVMKRCSGGNETPKLVRSMYEFDQEIADLAPNVYQLSSTQVLPLFCFCSTVLRSARDGSAMRLRSLSENYRSTIEEPSEQGGTWLGLGRYQVGSFSAYSLPIGGFSFGLQPGNKQRTTEEQANKEQGKTKQSPKKEQRIGSAFADLDKIWKGEVGHTSFGSYSPLVRGMFGKCLSIVYRLSIYSLSILYVFLREKIEKHKAEDTKFPKPVRSSSEQGTEEESKTARSGCENTAFQKGAQTKVELALTQAKTKVELGMNYQTTKDELTTSLERTNVELATTQETPKNGTRIEQESHISAHKKLPERYCKGTGKVLNSGGKGTGEVLESYQRGTKEVLTGSRSVVGLERDGGCFGVVPTSRNGEAVVNDLRMNRLILRSFRALCEEFRAKVESMSVGDKIKQQRGLKCVRGSVKFLDVSIPLRYNRHDEKNSQSERKKVRVYSLLTKAYSLQLITLLCVLFSFPDLLGARAFAQTPQQRDNQQVTPLLVGQRVPDEFWTKEHLFYNEGDTVRRTLEAYKGKMLILGFWATWCSSCLLHEPIIKKYTDNYPQDLAFVKVNPVASKDDLRKIDKTMRLNPSSGTGPGTVIYDSYLDTLFPHHGYPSYVWINKLGIIQMVTFRNLLDQNFVAPFISYRR